MTTDTVKVINKISFRSISSSKVQPVERPVRAEGSSLWTIIRCIIIATSTIDAKSQCNVNTLRILLSVVDAPPKTVVTTRLPTVGITVARLSITVRAQ